MLYCPRRSPTSCSSLFPGGIRKVLHVLGGVEQLNLPQGRSLHCSINALDDLLMPETLGVLAAERSDHATSI